MVMKAIFINAENGTVTDIEMGNDLQSFYNVIKCDLIECIRLNVSHDLVIDEEGTLKQIPYGFSLPGLPFIHGNAVIVGVDNNNGKFVSVNKKLKADFFRQYIKFYEMA